MQITIQTKSKKKPITNSDVPAKPIGSIILEEN